MQPEMEMETEIEGRRRDYAKLQVFPTGVLWQIVEYNNSGL